jgi:hypothetical protein
MYLYYGSARLIEQLIERLIVRLINWLIERVILPLIERLFERLSELLIVRLSNLLFVISRLNGQLMSLTLRRSNSRSMSLAESLVE